MVRVVLGVHALAGVSAYATDDKVVPAKSLLLNEAKQIIVENRDQFIVKHKIEALLAKLSILESQSDTSSALDRARAIESPFYSSLALSGIAATEIRSDPAISAKHFQEGLARSLEIKEWNGSNATSLGYILDLLPAYPEKQSLELLKASRDTFSSWDGSDVQKGSALLSLSKVTTAIAPGEAQELLDEVALKSNHYWESIEYLGTFMAQQSMEEALERSKQRYKEGKDWPNDVNFLRAVLLELAKTDFPGAFAGIKEMQGLDQEITAVKLTDFLLAQSRKKEAQLVIDHIQSLKSDFNWTQESLKTLRRELERVEPMPTPSDTITPEAIDSFLKMPSTDGFQSISHSKSIVFRDEPQIRDFITKSLPFVEPIQEMGYPHHGSPRSSALGLLVVCSALIDEIPQALELSKRISIPELRASFLLYSYEAGSPMPSTVSEWPIHFWQHRIVQLKEAKSSPSNAVDNDDK